MTAAPCGVSRAWALRLALAALPLRGAERLCACALSLADIRSSIVQVSDLGAAPATPSPTPAIAG